MNFPQLFAIDYFARPLGKPLNSIEKLGRDRKWVAWWYSGLQKKKKSEDHGRLMGVWFREVFEDGSYGDLTGALIAVSMQGLVPLGSVWENGLNIGKSFLQSKTFDVNLDQGRNKFISFADSKNGKKPAPYNWREYPIFGEDSAWILEIIAKQGRLLIPSMEVLYAFYGRTSEIREILTTFTWEDAKSLIFDPDKIECSPDKWTVHLRKDIVNADSIIAAHLQYDPYAALTAGFIHHQFQKHYNENPNDGKFGAQIRVFPWFQGDAKIRVEGLWLGGTPKTFLALRIHSRSNPEGPEIDAFRDNENPIGGENSKKKGQFEGAVRTLPNGGDNLDFAVEENPGIGSASIQRSTRGIGIIGNLRKVNFRKSAEADGSSGLKKPGRVPNGVSPEIPMGPENEIAKVKFIMDDESSAVGPHWDVLRAIEHISENCPDIIQSVHWYTISGGYSNGNEVNLNAFRPKKAKFYHLPWTMINAGLPSQRSRGFILARAICGGRWIYVLEIERDPKQTWMNPDHELQFENFSGLIFELNDSRQINSVIETIVGGLPSKDGVFKHLEFKVGGEFNPYTHCLMHKDPLPGVETMRRAFYKMGIIIPEF